MNKPKILIIGPLAASVGSTLSESFETASLPRADTSLLDPGYAAGVRGIAVLGAVDRFFIDALPQLEVIASFGVGYDRVDVVHAEREGVIVTNTPDVLNEDVADTAIALLLNTVREFPRAEVFLRSGRWAAGERYPIARGTLRTRKIGIYGLGRIGRAIASRLQAFNVEIAYHSRRRVEDAPWPWFPSLLELAKAVDTLICAAPGGQATQNAINAEILGALGKSGVVINIGRGSTVDEAALIAALAEGTIMAAGLDVYAQEPLVSPGLLDLPNAVLLPHVGSATEYTRSRMSALLIDNLMSWFGSGRALTPVTSH